MLPLDACRRSSTENDEWFWDTYASRFLVGGFPSGQLNEARLVAGASFSISVVK